MLKHKFALTISIVFILNINLSLSNIVNIQPLKVDDVTVFLKGAEIYSSQSLRLPAGESEIVLTNVAHNINPQTLSVSATNGVMILSSQFINDYLTPKDYSPEIKILNEKTSTIKDKIISLNIQKEVISSQLEVIAANLTAMSNNKTALNAASIEEIYQFIDRSMSQSLINRASIEKGLLVENEKLRQLEIQLDQLRATDQQTESSIIVKLYSKSGTYTDLNVSYVVNNAGWVPAYDLNVLNTQDPIKLTYKADIYQNTGIDWKNVNLMLSTGNPSLDAQIPTIYPWYVNSYVENSLSFGSTLNEKQSYDVLYKSEAPASMSQEVSTLKGFKRNRSENNTLEQYVQTDSGGLNTTFSISIPYTIASNGKLHTIFVQNANVNADYKYIAVPKYDSDAFLVAEVKAWGDLNLLPGKTSIYYNHSFVGNGAISLKEINDGIELSLGREKRITVNQVENENNTDSVGFFKGANEKSYGYTMQIKNTGLPLATIEIRDIMPVLKDKRITLESVKLDNGIKNDDTGVVTWVFDLKKDDAKTIKYSYKVRYPKDLNVSGL